MKKRKFLLLLSTVILLITVLSFSAAASGSVPDQMAANSAAWWIAYNAGDTATCNALHDANANLANQLAGSSGSANYNSASGSWTISNTSGTTTSSSSSNGKSTTVTYNTATSYGSYYSNSSSSYTNSSIYAYMTYGGTNTGLVNSYNNAATAVSTSGEYGNTVATTSAENEVAVAQQVLGLTDSQAAQLQADLECAKADYDLAKMQFDIALASGDTATANAAKAAMDAAHDEAEAVRASYNYSGDSSTAEDGGYYYGDGSPGSDSSGGYFTVNITPTYTITASADTGGSISPSGSLTVTSGGSMTFTITPYSEYKISDVRVDGASVGAGCSYTFSNVTSDHTISAAFEASGHVSITSTALYDYEGTSLSSGTIKSGYGVFAEVRADYGDVYDVTVTARYNFSDGWKTVALTETSAGFFQFPINPESTQHNRCVYIPVATSDGAYVVIFTITATDAEGITITDTKTNTFTVKGSMYEDDFTGDSYFR